MKKLIALLFCFALLGAVGCDWVSPTETNVFASFVPLYDGTNTVNFRNESKGASNYQWLSGDGQSKIGFQPFFAYPADGTYTVSLRACPGNNMESNQCEIAEREVTVPQ